MVWFLGELSCGNRLTSAIRRFLKITDELELWDLPWVGVKGLNHQSFSRLDWYLVSKSWESHFNGVVQISLPRHVSNHAPIYLDQRSLRKGPIPFLFENMLLKEEGFIDLFKGWWMGFNFSGTTSFISYKIESFKIEFEGWKCIH